MIEHLTYKRTETLSVSSAVIAPAEGLQVGYVTELRRGQAKVRWGEAAMSVWVNAAELVAVNAGLYEGDDHAE